MIAVSGLIFKNEEHIILSRERDWWRTFAEHGGSAGALNWHWTDREDSGTRTDSVTDGAPSLYMTGSTERGLGARTEGVVLRNPHGIPGLLVLSAVVTGKTSFLPWCRMFNHRLYSLVSLFSNSTHKQGKPTICVESSMCSVRGNLDCSRDWQAIRNLCCHYYHY